MKDSLEDAAETFVKNRFTKQICGDEFYPDIYASREAIVESHILFAKWQQERSYSEEEVFPLLEILQKCKEYFLLKTDKYSDERADAIIDVMEQFKKK